MNRKTLLIVLGGLGLLLIGIAIGAIYSPMLNTNNTNSMMTNMPPEMWQQMAENGMSHPMRMMGGGLWMMSGMGILWLGAIAGIVALILVLARTRPAA